MRCIFCEGIRENEILVETCHFKVVLDIDPIQQGHLLIISKQHLMDMRELSTSLQLELIALQKKLIDLLSSNFQVDGVSIIQNNGHIMDEGTHFHVHLVPRYKEDQFWAHQIVQQYPLSVLKLKEQLKNIVG